MTLARIFQSFFLNLLKILINNAGTILKTWLSTPKNFF
jgi:hypothetical protein